MSAKKKRIFKRMKTDIEYLASVKLKMSEIESLRKLGIKLQMVVITGLATDKWKPPKPELPDGKMKFTGIRP